MSKKAFFVLLSVLIILPFTVSGSIVTCNGPDCTICKFFAMLANIYYFLTAKIATPLAVIALTVGGVMIMMSAGNPNVLSNGKKILWSAIIGLALVFGSWIIINFILTTLGYALGSWWNPNLSC